jgi:hypothetical protein
VVKKPQRQIAGKPVSLIGSKATFNAPMKIIPAIFEEREIRRLYDEKTLNFEIISWQLHPTRVRWNRLQVSGVHSHAPTLRKP